MFDYVFDIWVEDRHRNGAGLISQFSMLSNGPKLQYYLHDLWPRSLRRTSCYFLLGPGFWRSYLKLTAVIDTNYGKTMRTPNIPETYFTTKRNFQYTFLFVCTVSLTLVSDPTSRRFIRWLLFQMFIYIYIYIF